MKLPNFYQFEPLNSLKERMGLARDAFGALNVEVDGARLTAAELERLTSQDGLEIALKDLRVLDDGTLAYKDTRVLLYIRDVTVMGDTEPGPRYHLSNCSTLRKMREQKRFNRYVVTTRLDGIFNMNIIKGQQTSKRLVPLCVCQNCLGFLGFNDFRIEWGRPKRIRAVQAFSLDEFFRQYPKSLHTQKPKYDSDNAPVNTYQPDFSQLSRRVRAAVRFKCQANRCTGRPQLGADSFGPGVRGQLGAPLRRPALPKRNTRRAGVAARMQHPACGGLSRVLSIGQQMRRGTVQRPDVGLRRWLGPLAAGHHLSKAAFR